MSRPDALTHVDETACAVLDSTHCYPVVAQSDTLPSVVYYGVGGETLTTLGEGSHDIATAIRVEARDRSFGEVVRLSAGIVTKLRAGGRLVSHGGPVDDYDPELEIYRRTRTVVVR